MIKGKTFSWKKTIFIAAFILLYFLSQRVIDQNYTAYFNFTPRIYAMYLWTFLLGAYFAAEHIKSLFKKGEVFIDYGYLLISILCIFIIFAAFPLFGLVVGNFAPILYIIFWQSLFKTFNRN
ncbi:MAG: hypothetical protein GXY50_11240 [Syntrophomonadaceae bacterium]|nr:hypothetical protein [Syntrophomonadaceae bacterium]